MYVHCNGGKGRSTTVVVGYLMESMDWTPEAALRYVRARRKVRARGASQLALLCRIH